MGTYWTRETISAVIRNCVSVKNFRKRYPGAYSSMTRNGWHELKYLIPSYTQLDRHNPSNKPRWTRDTIIEAMMTCNSRKEFRRRYNGAYNAIKRHGWNDLFSHIPRIRKAPDTIWTRDAIVDVIHQCESVYQFRQKYPSAYASIARHNWYDLIKDMPRYSPHHTESPIWCVYIWEFFEAHAVYIGLTSDYKRRIHEELTNDRASPVYNFIQAHPWSTYKVSKVESELSCNDAARCEINYIEQYRNDGYDVLNRNRGGSLGSYNIINIYDNMTNDQLIDTALQRYSTVSRFRNGSKLLYNEITRRGLIDRVTDLLPNPTRTIYTREKIKDIIATCQTYSQFRRNYGSAFYAMKRHGWHDLAVGLPKGHTCPTVSELLPRFEEVLESVNSGVIDIKDGSAKLGISVSRFKRYAGNRLNNSRKGRRATQIAISEEVLRDIVNSINQSEMTVVGAAKQLGITVYLLTKCAGNRILPRSERKSTGQYCGDTPRPGTRSNESILSEVTSKYTTLAELRRDVNLIAMVKRHGLYQQVSSLLKHKNRKPITRSDVSDAVSKCTTYAEFMYNYPSEYQVAHVNHWDDLLSGLSRSHKKADEFTYEHIYECAHKCSSRTEFNQKYRSESYAAKKRGIYDDIVNDIPKMVNKKSTG